MKRIPDQIGTLVFLFKGNNILLGKKKRGQGVGYWNGYGGMVNQGELVEEAALRELREESGINKANLKPAGVLHFYTPTKYWLCHVFFSREFSGTPKETNEMKPRWFPLSKVPYDQLWEDDKYWLPKALNGKGVVGHFWFETEDWKHVYKHKVKTKK